MRDASEEIIKMQLAIVNQKTRKEKWLMSFGMIRMGICVVRNSIRKQQPEISETELRIATFRRIYQQDYKAEEMEKYVAGMRAFFEKNPPEIYEEM
jgi:hypothetical protein